MESARQHTVAHAFFKVNGISSHYLLSQEKYGIFAIGLGGTIHIMALQELERSSPGW